MKSQILKSKFFIILFIIFLIITLVCIMKSDFKYTVQARKKSMHYIQKKYDFKSTIVSAKVDKSCDTFSFFGCQSDLSYHGVQVTMKHDNHLFHVYVPFESKNSFGKPSDDYQISEIQQAYVNMITNQVGVAPFKYHVNFKKDSEFYVPENQMNFFSSYYNGSNLEDVIKGYDILFLFEYTEDIDFDKITNSNIINSYTYGNYIQFKSKEACKKNHSEIKNMEHYKYLQYIINPENVSKALSVYGASSESFEY